MKKTHILITCMVVVLAIAIITTSYHKTDTSQSNDTVTLGAALILTGDGATWGEVSKNGIELAVKDLNAKGGILGKKVTVKYEDTQADAGTAISAFNKLTEYDGAKFIIGPNWSTLGLPLVNLAAEKKVVLVSPSLGVKEFNEANPYLFNTWPHDYVLTRKLADFVYAKGYRNVAIFGAQDVWVKDQTVNFKEEFETLGGKVSFVYEPTTDTKDIRTEALKVKNDPSIDAVIMTINGYDLADIVMKQIHDLGIKLPEFSVTIDGHLIDACDGKCEGLTFLTSLTPTAEFAKEYRDAYNLDVQIGGDSAYDAVMMLAKAMEATKSTDPDVVKDYMATIKEYDGASGHLVSDGKRGFTKDYLIEKVIGGKSVTVTN